MSHFDYISNSAPGFSISAHTVDCPVAAAENADEKLYAIQFHPEVLHTVEGSKILHNFLYNVCSCAGDWKMDSFVEQSIQAIREKVGGRQGALCTFRREWILLWQQSFCLKRWGDQLTCVFVDHGLLRKMRAMKLRQCLGRTETIT